MGGLSTSGWTAPRYAPRKEGVRRLVDRESPLRRMDWPLVLAALALSGIGSLLVWSATRDRSDINQGDPQYFLVRHLLNTGIGVALCVGVVLLGHHRLRTAVPFIYGLSILGVLAVLSPLGSTVNGAHSWIVLGGGFSVQPSEFCKLAIILIVATILSARVDAGELQQPDGRSILRALGLAMVPIGIVLMMPDLGSTMVMVVIILGLLLASGAPGRWLLGLTAGGALGAFAVVQLHLLKQYQIARFAAFADPTLDPSGVGYNTAQARIAIGSGGLTGQGLFHGAQTTGQFVPEQQTDFVFTVAGEELGFVGGMAIIVLLGVIIWRGFRIAREAPDLYSTVLAAGVVTWFAFQGFENIGMTLGIMPVAGIPLPFVSYGGSSMFAIWIGIGILQSVKMQRSMAG
ncbi:rod shape-determining protein RodA [Streptacidiphilus fuscans]|uniref:peptidoglycan glycosyltransferase n=1 Tax=Streptacidiphilus fuscans TaxID=2789292 RepID=A0A931B4Y4_9ACTN|nr:rod shape-determining protein RodA [Streptacidiphilus fuscans]MBF9070363.1 rod shape-determining protein RodA [Streptacidiphilus fuscans]